MSQTASYLIDRIRVVTIRRDARMGKITTLGDVENMDERTKILRVEWLGWVALDNAVLATLEEALEVEYKSEH